MKNQKKLSLSSSSGGGYNYEHIIQSQLILDLFYSNKYFNNEFFQSFSGDKIIFQAKNFGYNNDDLVIIQKNKTLLFQITEETINYTSKSPKFSEFIKNSYKDYLNNKKNESILVKSNQNIYKDKIIEKFLNNIKKIDYTLFTKSQKSIAEDKFLNAIKNILIDYNLSGKELFEFIKTIYIFTKDNNNDFSIEYKNLINNNIKSSNYELISSYIIDYCFKKSINGEMINYLDVYYLLKSYLNNKSTILFKLLDESETKLNSISDNVNEYHIDRDNLVDKFIKSKNKINIIFGNPGVGKSAIAKNIYYKMDSKYKVYVDAEDICRKDEFLDLLIDIIKILENADIIIDRTEKLFENDNGKFLQFLKISDSLNLTFIIREYSLNRLKDLLFDAKYNLLKIQYFPINEVSIKDVEAVLSKNNIIVKNEHLKELLKNLFYLNNVIKYSIILKCENEIVNEFKIKEKLFEAITENKEAYKNALISIFENKYKINTQKYLNFTNEIEYFIKHGIVKENHGNYSFSHDKFDDLTLFYILEGKYQKNLENLLITYNNIVVLRGLNVWLKDRIIMNKQEIFLEIQKIIASNKVLILYKNEIIKILFTEHLINEFIHSYGVDNFFNDEYMFNIIVSCSLTINPTNIILDKEKQKYATLDFFTMNQYIIPNREYLDDIANIIALNRNKITKININAVMKILKAICEHIKLYNEIIYELQDYYLIFNELLPYFEDYSFNESFRKDFLSIYYSLVIYNIDLAKRHLDNIIESSGDRYKLSRIEWHILDNLTQMEDSCTITSLYAKKFYDKICYIILWFPLSKDDESSIFYHERNDYGLKRSHIIYPSALSNQLYFIIREQPKETFEFINKFLNKLIENYKLKRNDYSSFEFESIKDIPLDLNQFVAYRGFGTAPNIIKTTLMAIERYILVDLHSEEKEYYLNKLTKDANSMMKISLIISIIKSEPRKYFEQLLLICEYKELLILDLNLTTNEQMSLSMYIDPFNIVNRSEREKASKFYNRNKSLWDILLELQSYKEYQQKIWNLYKKLSKKIGKTADEMIIKKRLHDYDIRNYVPAREVKKDNKKYIEFLPKQNDDEELKKFLDSRNNTKYVEHISIENNIKEILDGKKDNNLSIGDLIKEYNYNINCEYEFVNNDYLLLLSLKIKAHGIRERKFQFKAKKILISKLASKDMVIWENIYRKYLLSIIANLYKGSRKNKNIVVKYIIHCIEDSYIYDENIDSIKEIKKSNPNIYNQIIKSVYNKKSKEKTKILLILKIIDKSDIAKYLTEIRDLINYVCDEKTDDQDYMLKYYLSDFLAASIDNISIRKMIYNCIETNKMNYDFIEELIKRTINSVDSSKINNDLFWQFMDDISNILFKRIDNSKHEYYITNSNNYILRSSYLGETKIIRLLLMDYNRWNEKVHNWKAFDDNGKKVYLSIVKRFMYLPVGISAFCRTIWQFRDNFNPKILLDFSDIIEESSQKNNYFNDVDTEIILEFLLLDIYNKELNRLSDDELIRLSNIIMNFVLYTGSYRINYIYQQLLPIIYK